MNILIIGSSVFDKIVLSNNIIEYPGGIYHTTKKLIELKTKNDLISLCTQSDKKTFHYFEKVFNKCDQIYLDQLNEIPIVTLEEDSDFYRKETYNNQPIGLNFEKINFSEFDGILINMITGFELDSNILAEIRKQTKALIYFDVHTLSRKSEGKCKREFRAIPDFDHWAKSIDIIQVNEFESSTLFELNNDFEIAEKLFSYGVKAFIITKAEKGAKVFFKEDNEINFYYKTATMIKNVNTIGCGDYFGAAFFYNYLKTSNAILSLNFALDEVEKTLTNRLICN